MVNRSAGKNMDIKSIKKRGIFFTTLALIMITIVVLTYTLSTIVYTNASTQKRISSMNSFLLTTEDDLKRQLYVSAFRIVFILTDYITQQGTYHSNIPAAAEEIFFNGTLYHAQQPLMIEATFKDMQETIQTRARSLNLNLTLVPESLSLTQSDPWNINITLVTHLTLSDNTGLAKWDRTETLSILVPIDDFEDPLYIVSTNGAITNQIHKTPYTFVQGGSVANLLDHTLNSYYINTTSSPSFLDRLKGDLTADQYGIESLVNRNKQGIPQYEKSVVDYIYFDSIYNPESVQVQGMPSWFRLDNDHLSVYGLA